jgi:hypothetical protein
MAGARFLYSVQTSPEIHPASYPMGIRVISPGIKMPGYEADHSYPSSAEIKNGGAIPVPPYAFMAMQ